MSEDMRAKQGLFFLPLKLGNSTGSMYTVSVHMVGQRAKKEGRGLGHTSESASARGHNTGTANYCLRV